MALAKACAARDDDCLLAILGPLGRELIYSGDGFADQTALEMFSHAFEQAHEIIPGAEGRQILQVGAERWPLPAAILRNNESWHFETVTRRKDFILRRIASNEQSAIAICRLYCDAQNAYASQGGGLTHEPGVYARKFRSDPGKHNGLYWEDDASGKESPFAAQPALAGQEVPGPNWSTGKPFHGYYFRILTAQGKGARGGEKNYIKGVTRHVVGGKSCMLFDSMTDGFAMVAYPARYHFTGVRTFIVNQDGTVYQKNLGRQTVKRASEMTEFDPDSSWSEVNQLLAMDLTRIASTSSRIE